MEKKPAQKNTSTTKTTLIELFVIIAIMLIMGNFIYHILHWEEAFNQMKKIGIWGTLAVFAAVFYIKRWIDKL